MTDESQKAKHYEIYSDDNFRTVKIREYVVEVREGRAFWPSPSCSFMCQVHNWCSSPGEAFQHWREQIASSLVAHRHSVIKLERMLEISLGNVQVVREET